MSGCLEVGRTQRVPLRPGGPVSAVARGEVVTLVALGHEDVETRWVDLGPDGSFGKARTLPFGVEAAVADGDRLVLSGNEPGSDVPVVLVVADDGTVVDRVAVDRTADPGTLTRWPLPVATPAGPALLWESTDGLYWSASAQPVRRIGEGRGTDVLALAPARDGRDALIACTTVDGAAEVYSTARGDRRRLGGDAWTTALAVAAVDDGGWVVGTAPRGEHDASVVVLDAQLGVTAERQVETPGVGVVLSSSLRVVGAAGSIILSVVLTSRARGAGGRPATADMHAVTVLDADLTAGTPPRWLTVEPAGRLHHALAADAGGRVVVVHGASDAFVTELRPPGRDDDRTVR